MATDATEIAAMLDHVELRLRDDGLVDCTPKWRDVVIPNGITFTAPDWATATRVEACMTAGQFWQSAEVNHVPARGTYVWSIALVQQETVHADLALLGF